MEIRLLELLSVGGGAAIGGMLRYLTGRAAALLPWCSWPVGTLAVNLIGCLCLGLLTGWWQRHGDPGPCLRLFLTVGVCGGFTTFSTFVGETWTMLGERPLAAIAYAAVSLVGGLLIMAAALRG